MAGLDSSTKVVSDAALLKSLCVLCGPLRLALSIVFCSFNIQYSTQRRKGPQSTRGLTTRYESRIVSTNLRKKNPKSRQIQFFDCQTFERTPHKYCDTGRFALQSNVIDRWNIACTHAQCLFIQDVLHLQRGGRIQVGEDCKRSWINWKPSLERANQSISPRATSPVLAVS